tara:strand:- start:2487 stop:3587 length:1101 start_codon:yes stop_codon:yes gene_type:complete
MSDRMSPPKDSIGGTAASKILGFSKYGSKHDAYRDITSEMDGTRVKLEPNFDMIRGQIAEDIIVDLIKGEIEAETGFFIGEMFGNGVVRHPTFPFIHATVDRVLFDAEGNIRGIVEVKSYNSSFRDFDWERKDYRCQLEHYDCIFKAAFPDKVSKHGLDHNLLVVASTDEHTWRTFVKMHESGDDPKTLKSIMKIEKRRVDFDGSYGDGPLRDLVSFWTKHIEPRVMPDLDGSDGCKANLLEAFPSRSGLMEVDSRHEEYARIETLLARRRSLKGDALEIEAQRKDLRSRVVEIDSEIAFIDNQIKFIAGKNKSINTPSARVTVGVYRGRQRFSKDRFALDHPALYESYLEQGQPYETIKVTSREG